MKKHRCIGILLLVLFFAACEEKERPLDSDALRTIDSTATAQIRILRLEYDSLCKLKEVSDLPHLMDSLKKERLKEIEVLKKNEKN